MKHSVNSRVRELRVNLKMNLKKFSDESEISYSLLSKIETESVLASENVIRTLSERWNVSEIWLRTGKGEFSFVNNPKPKFNPWENFAVEKLDQHCNFLQRKVDELTSIISLLAQNSGKFNAPGSAGALAHPVARA